MIAHAFEAIIAAVTAWHQIMFVLAGLFLLLLGGLILAHIVRARLTGMTVNERVVAVRVTGSPTTGTPQEITMEHPEEPSWRRFAETWHKASGTGTLALLLALIVVGVPLLFVGIGAYLACDYIHLAVNGIAVPGTVTDSEYTSSAKGGSYYGVRARQIRL